MVRMVCFIACAAACTLMVTTGPGCARCGETIAERAAEKAAEQVTGADEISIGDRGNSVDLSELHGFLKYPGAKAVHRVRVSDDNTRGGHYGFETGDAVSKVAGWFETGLSGQGWKEPVRMESGEMTQLHYRSPDDKESVSVVISSRDGTTRIMVQHLQDIKK